MERKEQTITRQTEELPTKKLPERQVGGPQSGLPPDYIVGSELAPYLIVGIDFGTTFCRVSTFANGAPVNVQPHQFRALVEDALGSPIDETRLAHSLKHALSDDCLVKRHGSVYTASEVASTFLSGIKERIERNMEKLLAKAVISVPACFPHTQREALIQAATEAEISVLGLINEPTAAALDVCYMQNLKNGRYLVISNGAYSFEASIVHVQNKLLETKAIRGSRILSGYSITLVLTQSIAEQMPGVRPDQLQIAVDRAKQQFDTNEYVPIEIEGKTYSFSRTTAAECLTEATDAARNLIHGLLNDAGIKQEEIDGIILSGAASKLWVITDLLKREFGRNKRNPNVYAGNVAAGAAIYAALLVRQAKDWVVWDALADPVLVAQGTHLREIVSGNSPLPINGHASITPNEEGKASATILQRVIDREDELVQVATVSVVEQLQQGEEGSAVDLSITATSDGKLFFTARHKTLDINLTVRVDQPVKPEQPIIDLTPEEDKAAVPEVGFNPGFRVSKYGDQWLVDYVVEGSPAALAGLQVYDELLWIGQSHVFHLGHAVPQAICTEEGMSLSLSFSRGIMDLSLDLPCTESNQYEDPENLKRIISDAIVNGQDRRLVQALLNYAEYCIHHEQQTEATNSIRRALQISQSEFGTTDILYLRSLCCQCLAHMKASESSEEAKALCFNTVKGLLDEIAQITENSESLSAEVARLLHDVSRHAVKWKPSKDSSVIRALVKNALFIAAKQRIPKSVWVEFTTPLPDDLSLAESQTAPDPPVKLAWAESQADTLLNSLASLNLNELKKLQELGDGLASSLDANEAEVIQHAYAVATYYRLLGDWWLPFEFIARPDGPELNAMQERCKQWRIIPCNSSRLAYEMAKTILLRLVPHAKRIQDLTQEALCRSQLAAIYAGLGEEGYTTLETNKVSELVGQGAKLVHTTIQDVCNAFIAAGRYVAGEVFCEDQIRHLDVKNTRERLEYAEALSGLTRIYAIQDNYALCKNTYERLVNLFDDDDRMKFEYSVRYTEFLIRIEDSFATEVLKRTEKLGKKLGILTTDTTTAWSKRLKAKRGEKKFV